MVLPLVLARSCSTNCYLFWGIALTTELVPIKDVDLSWRLAMCTHNAWAHAGVYLLHNQVDGGTTSLLSTRSLLRIRLLYYAFKNLLNPTMFLLMHGAEKKVIKNLESNRKCSHIAIPLMNGFGPLQWLCSF